MGFCIFFLGVAELNNLCAPKMDFANSIREVFSFWLPVIGEVHLCLVEGVWYNMMMWTLGLGLLVIAFAFWLWED